MKKKFLAMAMAVALLTGCATMGGNSGGLFGGIDGASVLGPDFVTHFFSKNITS